MPVTKVMEERRGLERRLRSTGGALTAVSFFLSILAPFGWAEDGAREALELRYQAELEIAKEQAAGRRELAKAMRESLSGLLQEYLVTRDGSIALDTVDDLFVQEQFKTARAMEEPGVALALDVFSGPGTGYENELRSSLSGLADYQAGPAERAAERMVERDARDHKVSEAVLNSFEKEMERSMDRVERQIEKHQAAEQFDSKFEAKFEAKLDASVNKAERIAEKKAEKAEEKVEKAAEKAAEKVEKAAEKAEKAAEKAEEKAEKAAEKVEKAAEKAEKAAEKVEKAAEKVEKKEEKKEEKSEKKK
ncbi:MAG: hypothetical protein HYZ88_03045 [Candidatus Omnitrophica bacterium]|nr:hypothetical protein [Candidatus Omnitrophota bacterium]